MSTTSQVMTDAPPAPTAPTAPTDRDRDTTETTQSKHLALWVVQGLLAVTFLFAGGSKLLMSAQALAHQSPLPVGFLRFIGGCEALGALGLILPGVLRIQRRLTPVAAAGLVAIMLGATIVTLAVGGGATAVVPLIVGGLAALVARGRRTWLNP